MTCPASEVTITTAWLLGAVLRDLERPLPLLDPIGQWTVQAARRAPQADCVRRDRGAAPPRDAADVVLLAGLLRTLIAHLADRGSPGCLGGAFLWQEAGNIRSDDEASLAQVRLPLAAGALRGELLSLLAAAAVDVTLPPSARRAAALAISGRDETPLAEAMLDALVSASASITETAVTTPSEPSGEGARVITVARDDAGITIDGRPLAVDQGKARKPSRRGAAITWLEALARGKAAEAPKDTKKLSTALSAFGLRVDRRQTGAVVVDRTTNRPALLRFAADGKSAK